MKNLNVALLTLLMFSVSAVAQQRTKAKKSTEGQTTIKIEEAKPKNQVAGDIDEEITNAKLRAESGSKSKWSGSLTGTYYGGSLEKPGDRNRPNPTNEPIPPKTSMGGSLAVRYRADKNQSITMGTGYSLERPFHEAKRGQISNPYIGYTNAFKGFLGIQNISNANLYLSTDSDERELGQIGALYLAHNFMAPIGTSKATVGLALTGLYQHFTKYDEVVQPKGSPNAYPAKFGQVDYMLAVYPMFEYAFSDRVQFRTVFRPWIFRHMAFRQGLEFNKAPWTQSIGVGFAVTRDIYLYPNFQYDWEKWRRDDFNWARKNNRSTSTVGLSATINMF